MASPIKSVFIVGSGLVGRHWSMIFASAGYSVKLYDIDELQLTASIEQINKTLENYEAQHILRGNLSSQEQLQLISCCSQLTSAGLATCELIIECVPENLALKKKVFAQLDPLLAPHHVVSSSSSCIPASQFTEHLVHRSQCLVGHPVNPPYHLPLVELVPAPWTDVAVIQRARQIFIDTKQKPVTLAYEVPGFVANRFQYAVINQAWQMVHDGLLSAEDVDTVITAGLGPRYALYGPLAVMHLNAPNGFDDYMDRYGAGMVKVSGEIGQYPQYDRETQDKISKYFHEKLPIASMEMEMEQRDLRLGQINKIKERSNSM